MVGVRLVVLVGVEVRVGVMLPLRVEVPDWVAVAVGVCEILAGPTALLHPVLS